MPKLSRRQFLATMEVAIKGAVFALARRLISASLGVDWPDESRMSVHTAELG